MIERENGLRTKPNLEIKGRCTLQMFFRSRERKEKKIKEKKRNKVRKREREKERERE